MTNEEMTNATDRLRAPRTSRSAEHRRTKTIRTSASANPHIKNPEDANQRATGAIKDASMTTNSKPATKRTVLRAGCSTGAKLAMDSEDDPNEPDQSKRR